VELSQAKIVRRRVTGDPIRQCSGAAQLPDKRPVDESRWGWCCNRSHGHIPNLPAETQKTLEKQSDF